MTKRTGGGDGEGSGGGGAGAGGGRGRGGVPHLARPVLDVLLGALVLTVLGHLQRSVPTPCDCSQQAAGGADENVLHWYRRGRNSYGYIATGEIGKKRPTARRAWVSFRFVSLLESGNTGVEGHCSVEHKILIIFRCSSAQTHTDLPRGASSQVVYVSARVFTR